LLLKAALKLASSQRSRQTLTACKSQQDKSTNSFPRPFLGSFKRESLIGKAVLSESQSPGKIGDTAKRDNSSREQPNADYFFAQSCHSNQFRSPGQSFRQQEFRSPPHTQSRAGKSNSSLSILFRRSVTHQTLDISTLLEPEVAKAETVQPSLGSKFRYTFRIFTEKPSPTADKRVNDIFRNL
jgi:hypothetical protein